MKRKEPASPDKITEEPSNTDIIMNPQKASRAESGKKEEKYDRQIRLWGLNGQKDLENANVCLINVTAAGTEALKCLILPGVGRYSILDNTVITAEDVGNNFFFDSFSVGKSKAQIACELVQELNEDSVGQFYQKDPIELLNNDPEFFKKFTVVLCSRVSEHGLLKLGNFLWHAHVPLVVCDNFGYFGILRIVVKEHIVIEAHPDNALEDFRLDCPFPELVRYMNAIKLEEMSKLEHSHTPYLVLLYKYLEEWRKANNSQWPKSYQEKRIIKQMLREGVLKNDDGIEFTEENFDEAIRNVNIAYTATGIPDDIRKILNDAMANHPLQSEVNSKFWILIRSLKEFVNQKGMLPLRGTLPDMFSDSKRYIELQKLYKTKADEDIASVESFVREAVSDLQLPASFVSFDDIKLLCKNAFFLKVQRGLSVHDELKQDLCAHKINGSLQSMPPFAVDIYLLFRAIMRLFDDKVGDRYNLSSMKDFEKLKKLLSDVIQDIRCDVAVPLMYMEEILRCNVSEFHTTASILGGVCSQEVIKIITKQFVPIDDIFVYDGISQQTTSMKL